MLINKDRYLSHLSKEENEMLDIIADIVVGYVMRKHDEQKQKTDNLQSELNRYSLDSKPIVHRKKKSKKKALETQALSFLYPQPE